MNEDGLMSESIYMPGHVVCSSPAIVDEVKRYSVIVCDPPWSYGSVRETKVRKTTAEHHYKTMCTDDIASSTPVCELASDMCHLFMWVTNPKLPQSFALLKAWGFEYKTLLTWVKTRSDGGIHGGGMGWFFRGATEHVIFAVKGAKGIPSELRKPNVVMAKTTGHSEKPVEFYDLLRSIYPDEERMVDLYARRRHERFDAWGDEVT